MKFSDKSKKKLAECHEDLQKVFNEVINHIDVSIVCGYRGEKEQNLAYERGNSKLKYPKSRHNKIPSLAVDVIPYPTGYKDIDIFKSNAVIIKDVIKRLTDAGEITSNIRYGGDYKNWKDYPHWEIIL